MIIARIFEIFIIICAVGGGLFFIRHLVSEFRAARAAAKQDKENRRVIAVSKAMAALKKRDKLDLEITLRLYGDEMGEDLAKSVRDTLIDIAYNEAGML